MRNELVVSIIIPLYNRSHLILKTLESVIKQSFSSWECIIVDDHSTDNSFDVAQSTEDKRIKVFKRPIHLPKGANACRNYGLDLSTGDYICFLDSDDVLHPDKLSIHLKLLADSTNKIVASVLKSYRFENTIENITKEWGKLDKEGDWLSNFIEKKIAWQTCAALWKREFLSANPFNENLQAGQDYEFHVKQAMKYGRDRFVLNDFVAAYIRSDNHSIGREKSRKRIYEYAKARLSIIEELRNSKKDKKYFKFVLDKNRATFLEAIFLDHPPDFTMLNNYLSELKNVSSSQWLWTKFIVSIVLRFKFWYRYV